MIFEVFKTIFIFYNIFCFLTLIGFCGTKKNFDEVVEKNPVKNIINIFFSIGIIHFILLFISTWFPEGTILDDFRISITYGFKEDASLLDLFYTPSFLSVIFVIYIVDKDSWLDVWEYVIPIIGIITILSGIGHIISDTIVPSLVGAPLLRKIAFVLRYFVLRGLIFIPLFWYNKMNIKTKENYFTFIISCGLALIFINITLGHIYNDFLNETFMIFWESTSIAIFYIITSIKIRYDIGEEEMKIKNENLFQYAIITMMGMSLFSPFLLKAISMVVEKNLDYFTLLFALVLQAMAIASLGLFRILFKLKTKTG